MSYIKHKIPASHEEWKKNRLAGIGGSDAAIALGMSPWTSPFTLWCEKTGLISNDKDNEAMRLGRDLEEYVAYRFCEVTGKKVRRSSYSYQSVEHPFMLANVDRLVVGEDAGLECKITSALTRTKYDKGDIPIQYYTQCMHYMATTGKKKWYLAVLVLGINFYVFEVLWDDEEVKNLIEQEKDFWHCVTEHIEPDVDGSTSTKETLKKLYPESNYDETIELDLEEELQRLDDILPVYKRAEKVKKTIENKIKNEMKNNVYAVCGNKKIKLAPQKQERVDSEKLKTEYPEIYKQVLKETKFKKLTIEEEKENDYN